MGLCRILFRPSSWPR